MKRRSYLLTAGVAIASVGCMKRGDPVATLHPQSSTGTEKTYAGLKTERLITAESVIGKVPWAYITVSNNTEYDHGLLQLNIRFYDEAQSLVHQQPHSVARFPANTMWTTFHPVTTYTRDSIASVEANIERAETGATFISPDSVSIEDSRLAADAGTGVRISGTLSAGAYTGQVRLVGLVYDSQDRFRGTVATTSDRLSTDEQWDFDATNPTVRTPMDRPYPDSYDLLIEQIEE